MLGGKTLMAVLRDAAETVADGLDEGRDPRRWAGWVDALFGSQPAQQDPRTAPPTPPRPRPAALQARPLHLPAAVRVAVRTREDAGRVTAALVTRRPGVRIDPDSGVAADDMLRIEERARAGLTVMADWIVHFGAVAPGTPRCRGKPSCCSWPRHGSSPRSAAKRRRGADIAARQRLETLLDRSDQPGPV